MANVFRRKPAATRFEPQRQEFTLGSTGANVGPRKPKASRRKAGKPRVKTGF